MRRHKIRQTDQRDVQSCIDQLQALIDGLRAGDLGVGEGADPVLLKPGGMIAFELRVDQSARKETLRVEMSWRPEPSAPQALSSVASVRVDESSVEFAGPKAVSVDASRELPPPAGLPHAGAPQAVAFEEVPSQAVLSQAMLSQAEPLHLAVPSGASPPPLPPVAAGVPEPLDSVENDGPLSTRSLDRKATAEYQRLFEAARVLGSDGHWHIDQDRLIVSLESAGVDPLTQQELYALALQADADGRASMLSERVIEAIKQVSQHPTAPAVEPPQLAGSP